MSPARWRPARHAQIISTVYVITYLGSAIPVIGLGLAAGVVGLQAAVAGFVTVCSVAALTLAAITLRTALRRGLARRRHWSAVR